MSKCEICERDIVQMCPSMKPIESNWIISGDRLVLTCKSCYSQQRWAFKNWLKNKKEVGLMTLLIAILLIWGFNFPWWMYLVTMGVWVGTRLIKSAM